MVKTWLSFGCEPTVQRLGILSKAKQVLFSVYDNIKGEVLMERMQRVWAVNGEGQSRKA